MNYNPYLFPFYYSGYPYFENFMPVDKPPTLYSILNAKLNFEADKQTKISDLAAAGRSFVFDFNYILSSEISKSDFETLFIDHFLERRIGFETFNSFKIHLRAKLREILPYYNKLFDSLADLKIIYDDSYTETLEDTIKDKSTETLDRNGTSQTVTDGTKTEAGRIETDGTKTEAGTIETDGANTESGTIGTVGNDEYTATETVHEQGTTKFSDTPQNQLSNVTQNRYMTDYTDVAQDKSTTESTDRDTTSTETRNLANTINSTETRDLENTDTQTQTVNKNYGEDSTVNGMFTDGHEKENERTTSHEYTKTYIKPFANQLENYQKYLETKQSIFTLLLNDLEDLFLLIY